MYLHQLTATPTNLAEIGAFLGNCEVALLVRAAEEASVAHVISHLRIRKKHIHATLYT